MLGQRPALRLAPCVSRNQGCLSCIGPGAIFGDVAFNIFQGQLELFDQAFRAFRRRAEPGALQLEDLKAQVLDEVIG